MVIILMISSKMATLGLLKIKLFWNKCYNVVISLYNIIKKLSHDLNYIVSAVMWPKFGSSSISMREVIVTSILYGFDQKNIFFEGWSCFKFNNLGMTLGIALKFYASVEKVLKLKVRSFWDFYKRRSYREKTDREGLFAPPLPPE